MGTDIHGRIEMRWSAELQYHYIGPIEDQRNYRVFAMLAGVRNGFGFAGVKTFEPLLPVSEPRGLPEGVEAKDDNDYEFGDHSQSWVTLREVLDWPGWKQPLHNVGVLERKEWERLRKEGGVPNEWSGGVSGPNVRIVFPSEAKLGGEFTHVQYEWSVPFEEMCSTFRKWVDYLEDKHSWLMERDPAAVRLVFGFDS